MQSSLSPCQRHCPLHHGIQHRLREATCESILLAWIIAAEQCVRAYDSLCRVTEARFARGGQAQFTHGTQDFVPRKSTQPHDNSHPREKPAWPHPVIANGKLYLRDQDLLFCYVVKE